MTKKWPTFLQNNFRLPETVAEAVEQLMVILSDEQKVYLVAMQEDDLIDLHFTLGLAIRNAFGLHVPGSKLLTSCNNASHPGIAYNATHPDDASAVIIRALWLKLN